jgi:hypothetical protein
MALANYPECGHQVSDKAETCPACGMTFTGQFAQWALQAELDRVDLDWERERKRWIVRSLWGKEFVPNPGQGVVGSVALGAMALCFVFAGARTGAAAIGLAFGSFFLVCAIWNYLYSARKAAGYDRAEAQYERNKEAAGAKYCPQAEGQTPRPVVAASNCPKCGHQVRPTERVCLSCGRSLSFPVRHPRAIAALGGGVVAMVMALVACLVPPEPPKAPKEMVIIHEDGKIIGQGGQGNLPRVYLRAPETAPRPTEKPQKFDAAKFRIAAEKQEWFRDELRRLKAKSSDEQGEKEKATRPP